MVGYIKIFFATVSVISMVFIVLNFFIDSNNFFGSKNDKIVSAAENLLNGHQIGGFSNVDDRLFNLQIIKNLPEPPSTIIIGSSRTMMIRKNIAAPQTTFFNHSVSAAALEDYFGIIGAYLGHHNELPKRIILGVDPWVFNSNNEAERWKTLNDYYKYFCKLVDIIQCKSDNIITYKLSRLMSYDYVLRNIEYILFENNEKFLSITAEADSSDIIKSPDGSIYYPAKIIDVDRSTVSKEAKKFAKGKVFMLENFDSLENTDAFEKFLSYLEKHDVEVVFLLVPLHPVSYSELSRNPKYAQITKAEEYLTGLARKRDIQIIGSYNPALLASDEDFFDGMHAKERLINRLLTGEALQ